MGKVVFVADSAHDPVREPASVGLVQARRPQYAQTLPFELGERHRSDAPGNVRLDDAAGIRPLFKGTDVHRDVRPGRPGDASHQRRHAGVALREQDIAMPQHRGERLHIGSRRRTPALDRPR